MNRTAKALGLALAAGLAATAAGQDSVSTGFALPGDALDAYSSDTQVVNYVVDLTPFTTSGGTEFGIAPLVKASKGDPMFFNHLISAQAISRTLLTGVPFPGSSAEGGPLYAVWDGPGFGVNPETNLAPNFVSPSGLSNQFAVAFNEFGGLSENVTGALVNVDPSDTSRLYVSRIMAAVNGTQLGESAAALGGVSVDSHGNAHFRADGFGVGGSTLPPGSTAMMGNNIFRIAMSGRAAGMINLIDNSGGSDVFATDRPVAGSTTTHTVPNVVPEQLAGRPIYVGPNFDSQWVSETSPNMTTGTTAHLSGLPGGSGSDHRGSIALSESIFFPGSVATLGVLTKSVGDNTDTLSVWGVDSGGALVGSPKHLIYPASGASDPIDPFSHVMTSGEFDHYHSQTPFRGGVSQVAIGSDQQGRGLAAGVAYIVGGNNDPSNVIAVARFDGEPGSPVEWTLAAWTDATTLGQWPVGKPILDSEGEPIGELTTLFQVTNGSPFGPSFSAPAIDAAGNIWFLSAIQLFVGENDDNLPFTGGDLTPPDGDDIYTVGLIRAVYDPDAFGYNLELVLRLGDTFRGQNSDTDYTITFMPIADNDSINSGTFFSGNVMETAWNGIDITSVPTSDPRTAGGVVINASIAYQSEAEGAAQEFYNTALFIGALNPESVCVGDLNGDSVVDGADLAVLLANWGPGSSAADLNDDDEVNGADLAVLLANWGDCQ